ncbi:Bifunctional purine biosynthesis protein PurH [Coemansia pectinata]|uniref:Bifunctional purine biosynthesis protein PurH n=1 Tax=Coemansia pectinata TaxID=1052879 RepID=A0A9W8GV51_9FUNG|nr:Bifunctional purine biosynthesis protein PurH [Coemansia pectinata]
MTPGLADNLETALETDDGAPTSIGLAIVDEPVLLPPTLGQPAPSLPTRPATYSASDNTAGSAPSSTGTRPIENHYIHNTVSSSSSRRNSGNYLDSKKGKPAILEGDEKGISRTDSRYSRLNRSLLLCAIAVALSSINYGWVIGSVNIPALVIEECSDGPETWTNGFPSCIPMGSIMWGLVVGLTPLGAWAGSMFSGVAADRFGRKRILIFNNAFFVAGALLSSTSTSIVQLGTGRFVSGIGCGVASNLVSTYNSEAATVRSRGFLGGFQQLMILVGLFLSQVVSIGLSAAPLWRVLFSISAGLAIFQSLVLFFVPESPKFLAKKGRMEESQAALQRLRTGMDISLEFEDLVAVLDTRAANAATPPPTLWQVLSGKTEVDLRHLVFCVLFLMMSQQWSGAKGVMFYSTEILSSTFHLTTSEKQHIPSIAQLLTLGIGAIGAVAVIIGMNILDKAGRRTVLIASSLSTSICAALIVVGSKLDVGPLVATAMYLFNLVFQSGAGFIPYLSASELLPYNVLGSISGLAASVNCLTLFIVSFTFPILDKALGPYLFTPFIATNFITFLFGVFLMPEAKGKPVSQVVAEYQGPIHLVSVVSPRCLKKPPPLPVV